MRLAVLTNAPAPYRVPIFERLAREEGVVSRVFFDGASDATTRGADLPFPCEHLAPVTTLRLRNYQDEREYAERIALRFGFSLLPRLAAFRPDAVISGEFGWRTLQAAAYATLVGIPLLVWWEGTPFTERHVGTGRTSLRRIVAGRAAALLGFGSGSVDYLERIAASDTPVHFVPQAVDNARIAREVDRWRADREALRVGLGVRGTVLLCVSRLLPHKGIRELLEALERLRAAQPRCEFHVLLAGDGPLLEAARRAEESLGGRLRVLGAVPPDELPMHLAAADALVFPTLRDCWGMVVNEALAAGIPVLGSRYAGACDELLAREGTGLRFDPLDPPDFDAALRAAVVERRLHDASIAGVRRAIAAHTCENAARALLDAARCSRSGVGVPSAA